MATFDAGSWVWITDEQECYLPAKVKTPFKPGEEGRVQTEDGEDHVLSSAQTQLATECNLEVLSSAVDNLINLSDLNENAILHNLRIRYKEDLIYTYVSSILISVNPFKLLPLYTPEMLDDYRSGTRDKPPHIFATASNSYQYMLSDRQNQSVVISGESGAGKSEATKLILQFLADVSTRAGGSAETGGSLEQQVLAANPIMEAFGNAKTVRNNNSSRFGKLITVRFDNNGSITGGSIVNYLLEKTRVIRQSAGERNYHVFYQLLAGCEADAALKAELCLDSPEMFHFTNQSGVIYIENLSDEKEFEEVRAAMDTLNFTMDDQLSILKTVAGVLHFGNVQFEADARAMEDETARIANNEQLALAARMWGLEAEHIEKALTSRNIGTRSVILVNYNLEAAQDARDAMCKRTYSMLFEFIIAKINDVLEQGANPKHSYIGVLDIFGFESFENNSFEQLCINYCNEKLQFHFNEHIFRLEQDMYQSEGVVVPSTAFKDNQPTLDLIEARQDGIFAMIDDEISVPKGTDETMLNKLKQKHTKHANFVAPKPRDVADHMKTFGVRHYAGDVFYNVTGFLEKNKDVLHPDIVSVLRASSSEFIRNLYPADEGATQATRQRSRAPAAKQVKKTLGAQFKEQLAALMDTLNATSPHFVRCMKPNDMKSGDLFTATRMLDQLRYAGLLEVCRIRKLGYPVRRDFDEFYKRYRCIVPGAKDLAALLAALASNGFLEEEEWAKGRTKVFMRTAQATSLEIAREAAYAREAKKVQKIIRGFIMRCKWRQWHRILTNLRAAMGTRNEEDLNYWLDMSAELPNGGKHLALVKDGRLLQVRLAEERRIKSLLEAAIANRDISGLRAAVQAAETMNPPLDSELVPNAKALIARLEEEQKVKRELLIAINNRSKPEIIALLQKADELDLDCDEVRQATALKARLEEEEEAVECLKQAIADRNLSNLAAFIAKCQELGLEIPEIEQGQKLQQRLQAEIAARHALMDAIEQRDLEAITIALEKAATLLDASVHEVVEAKALQQVLRGEAEARAMLDAAAHNRDLAALDAAIQRATSLGMDPAQTPEITHAMNVRDAVMTENAAMDAVRAAIASNNLEQLNAALKEVSRLGLGGPDVETARAASQKLGAQSALRTKLSTLTASDNLEAVQAALAEAEGMGMMHSPEAEAVIATRDRLLEEQHEIQALEAAMAANSLPDLSRAVASCNKLNLGNKYNAQMSRAKEQLARLTEQSKANTQLSTAVKARDLEGLIVALQRAGELSITSEEIAAAERLRAELEQEQRILSDLSAAMAAKDFERVTHLMSDAEQAGVSSDKLQQARIMRDRDQLISKTKKDLAEATANQDLARLQEAIEMAIQLGLEIEEVSNAKKVREQLMLVESARNDVTACHRALEAKAQSKGGITHGDLDPINHALREAQAKGIPDSADVIMAAVKFRERMERQLAVQDKLEHAMQSKNRDALASSLDEAEDLNLKLDSMEKVKALLKEIETERRAQEQAQGEAPLTDEAFERMEAERRERQQRAKQERYRFENFNGLRSPDDFAKGVILNKKKIKDSMLCWQNSLITKSLLDIDKDLNKFAVQIHKDLLGYMGDKTMNFPATLAQDILQKGFEHPALRDEIYMQIMKQLTHNPRAESIAKGWQVMCMCVSTFPPSLDFENYLLNFILEKKESKGAVRNYANYCLRTLEGMLSSGESSGFVPSVEEIQAYKERPPILATIELVDGQVLTEDLPVTPDLNVGKVLEICSGWLQLQDPRSDSMGIFVYDEGLVDDAQQGPPAPHDDLPRTPRPLRNEDFMGDVIVQKARQKRTFKFVLKKKIFLNDRTRSDDPMYSRLLYLQAEDETLAQDNIPIANDAGVAELAAISLAVAYGEEFPEDVDSLCELDVLDFVVPSWRDKLSVEAWARKILAHSNRLVGMDPEELQCLFVEKVQDNALYGCHFFYVHKASESSDKIAKVAKLPHDLLLAFNHEGMHVFNFARAPLLSVGYADIYRWGGSSSQFSMIIWDQEAETTFELIVTTAQAADMAAIILDHIKAIMASQPQS